MSIGQETRRQIGRFLRQCRERLGPREVGLPMTRRRRTPGLRREEVALLAGISVTYYTKIEQGHVDVSDQALSDIVRVLKLNHAERNYVFALATGRTARHPDYADYATEEISPVLEQFLILQNPYPAQIMGRRWDILAWNQATCAALGDLDAMPPQARNLMLMMFTAPPMKEMLLDWEVQARRVVAEFRADYVTYRDDPAFDELVDILLEQSPEFKTWWHEAIDVGSAAEFEKPIMHPQVGLLQLYETIFTVTAYPTLRTMLFLPQNEETAQKLEQLYLARMAAQQGDQGVLRERALAYGD